MDEVQGVNQGKAIGFRTFVDTRGLDISWQSDLKDFYVTAYKEDGTLYFKDVLFVSQGESYVSAETYYWPKNEKLIFHAYAPGIGRMGEEAKLTFGNAIDVNVPKIENFKVNENIDQQNDLIYAIAEGTEEDGEVEINFSHLLSRIFVQACTRSDYEYKLAGVRIGGVNMSGTLNAEGPATTIAWTTSGDPGVFERVDLQNPIVLTKSRYEYPMGELADQYGNMDYNYAFMIPQEFSSWDPTADQSGGKAGAYISVLVQVNKNGLRIYPENPQEEYEWVSVPIPALNDGWTANVAYSYTLDFTYGIGFDDEGEQAMDDTVIKVSMSMDAMDNAEEGVVVNPKMIGEWKAKFYEFRNYDRTTPEDDWVEDTDDYMLIEDDMALIGQHTQHFGHIKIYDGTKMWTDRGDTWVYTDYYMIGETMYIDVYRNDDDSYIILPEIVEISEVDEPQREVTVKVTDNYSTYSKNEILLKYDILPISD